MMSAVDEVDGASFSDIRLARRLKSIVGALEASPKLSFPDASRSDSELEATYRFLSNDNVSPAQILAPHIAATRSRARGRSVYVVHDTTQFRFEDREGMGRLSGEGVEGFSSHASLAVEPGEERMPLGVVAMHNWTRDIRPVRPARKVKTTARPENRESSRWIRQAIASEVALGDETSVIHLMDSEADSFALLSQLISGRSRFVIRLHVDRKVIDKNGVNLSEKLGKLSAHFFREVALAPRQSRPQNAGRRNPPRASRIADLSVSASQVTIAAPDDIASDLPKSISLNIVRVFEPSAPEGCTPVEWRLATTEPIKTHADLERVVDAYRSRWVIEDFFKALKTGCAFEKRQLETYDALLNALAVFAPIAYELLRLRAAAAIPHAQSANGFFRPSLWTILRYHKSLKVPEDASIQDCYSAIARIGGHIKNNGQPGWIVLARGYEKILAIEEGYLFSREICDQS
jgi:hypothetical protein